jgi:hypothetical protein
MIPPVRSRARGFESEAGVEIAPQPDHQSCGATCLHAVYRYYGRPLALEQVIEEVPRLGDFLWFRHRIRLDSHGVVRRRPVRAAVVETDVDQRRLHDRDAYADGIHHRHLAVGAIAAGGRKQSLARLVTGFGRQCRPND